MQVITDCEGCVSNEAVMDDLVQRLQEPLLITLR